MNEQDLEGGQELTNGQNAILFTKWCTRWLQTEKHHGYEIQPEPNHFHTLCTRTNEEHARKQIGEL
jgi:hypothetical protein